MTSSVFILSIQLYSQRLTPTECTTYTEGHTMWFLKCSSMKHLSSACTCSLCLYPFFCLRGMAGGSSDQITHWPPCENTQMMTNEHGTEITSPCPSTTDLPNICTSLAHKLACIYIAKPGRFSLLFKVDQLLSIRSRDCSSVACLSFQPWGVCRFNKIIWQAYVSF